MFKYIILTVVLLIASSSRIAAVPVEAEEPAVIQVADDEDLVDYFRG